MIQYNVYKLFTALLCLYAFLCTAVWLTGCNIVLFTLTEPQEDVNGSQEEIRVLRRWERDRLEGEMLGGGETKKTSRCLPHATTTTNSTTTTLPPPTHTIPTCNTPTHHFTSTCNTANAHTTTTTYNTTATTHNTTITINSAHTASSSSSHTTHTTTSASQ